MTTTTTKTILFASLIAAMILPFSGMMMAEAAPNENANDVVKMKIDEPQDIESSEYDVTENFQEFSDTKINQYRMQIESDTEIKSLMEGSDFKYSSIAYRLDPVVTVFDITYENEDKTKMIRTK
jgi:hypothetical protein